MVEDLPEAVFQADDSLGWVYQFWQSKRKDEVNDSGDKIGADELPAVTQLFTEHYMVQFLLDNTLEAWWTDRHPGADIDLDFEYLRFVEEEETGEEVPAAGTFEGWPDTAAELTVMDPCMGSGHFLVAALPMLARMRMHEEDLSAEEAVDRVIEENLHGLEIDERCTQIGAFALAMAAWTFDGTSGYRELPEMNLACSGLAPEGDLEDWETLAGDDERLQNGMRRLYSIFQDAPTLGSLIDPSAPENRLDTATFEELEPLLKEALSEEEEAEAAERGVVAHGIARAADMLSKKFHLVATNVPYRKSRDHDDVLRNFCRREYPRSDRSLETVFMERCRGFGDEKGVSAVVSQQKWLFSKSFTNMREHVLRRNYVSMVSPLGVGAFETISGEMVNVALHILENGRSEEEEIITGIDALLGDEPSEKKEYLISNRVRTVSVDSQIRNPDSRILLISLQDNELLSEYADSYVGLQNSDINRFTAHFWENNRKGRVWSYLQMPTDRTDFYRGRTSLLRWEKGNGVLSEYPKAYIKGDNAWGKRGIAVRQTSGQPCTLYDGSIFDQSTAVLIPKEENLLKAIWCYCSSDEYSENVEIVDKNMKVTNANLVKVPFDPDRWQEIAEKKYPGGLPDPYSDDPTQWIFHGHPKPGERPLQVAVARLLGYRWPAESSSAQGTESSSAQAMELADKAREWIERCAALDEHVDDDGIVCIPAVQGERPAADRIRELLADAYGNDWGEGVLQDLLDEWGYRSGGFQAWLDGATARQKGKFAQQHNKLFAHRPFIWHVSDEHADGFSALVNYHQLDRANLERLTYTYLGDWINQQEAAMERGEDGAEGRLLAAQDLQDELKKIIEGEPPYDIFVRWKEAHEQPIGWEPDLNDGVLLNIKPFIEAGILRDEPNVRYTKDRGKNPEGAPWGPLRYNRYEDVPDAYKLKDEDGEVIERLTNEEKRRVREKAKS
jgi:hypothetical protein